MAEEKLVLPPPVVKKKVAPLTEKDRSDKIAKPYVDTMKLIWSENKCILQEMNAKMISPDQVFEAKCESVLEALEEFTELSDKEMMHVQEHILQKSSLIEMFLHANASRRACMVEKIIRKGIE